MKQQIGIIAVLLAAFACSRQPSREVSVYHRLATREAALATAEGMASPAEASVVDVDRDLLLLPAGTRIEYVLFALEGSILRVDRIVPSNGGLTIWIETDERGREKLAAISEPVSDLTIPLPIEERQPMRLVLESRATDGASADGEAVGDPALDREVVLRGAALWAPTEGGDADRREGAFPGGSARPNVVLYLIDTLRTDRLGSFRGEHPVTPNLDRFAERATVVTDAVGQSSWTKASIGSMFSGTWPPAHGAIGWDDKLSSDIHTLAEILQDAGYRTAAFVTNPNIVPAFGFDQGFDDFTVELDAVSERINEMVAEWLGSQREEPFFLYIHTIDPHVPYYPPEPFRSRFAPGAAALPAPQPGDAWRKRAQPYFRELYDGEVAANDHSFGQLVDLLEREDLFDDSLVLVISDHGEEFKEHGQWGHGKNLHAETLDFPWLIKFPGQTQGRSIGEPVQHIDLLPTILDSLGLPVGPTLSGRSLRLPLPARRAVYSHLELGDRPVAYSVVDGDWKLIRTNRAGEYRTALFNRKTDPEETRNLAADLPVRTEALAALLAREIAASFRQAPAEKAIVDAELERRLRALGYLQ